MLLLVSPFSTMQSVFCLAVALGFIALANSLSRDEIHTLALGSAGVLSGLWGLATAPSLLQIGLSIFLMGWLRLGGVK